RPRTRARFTSGNASHCGTSPSEAVNWGAPLHQLTSRPTSLAPAGPRRLQPHDGPGQGQQALNTNDRDIPGHRFTYVCSPARSLNPTSRWSKSALRARPVYHRQRDSIEAHLTIVFAALAVSRRIERQSGRSIRKFVKTARRYRTIQIQAGPHTITAAHPLPDDLRQALDTISGGSPGAH